MIELIDKRKPNEKYYLKDNGNCEVHIFNHNVHFFRDGKYEEISNILVENQDLIEVNNREIKISFDKKDGSIKYMKEGKYLKVIPYTFKPNDYVIELNGKESSKIKFLSDNVDLEYIISSGTVKENIIIKNEIKYNMIEYILDSNLNLVIEKNKLIAFQKNVKIFEFIPPYMKDANGVESNDTKYELQKEKLTINFDKKWINSSKRKYPVVIDPTIIEKGTNAEDTYIYDGDTSDVRYNREYLIAGVQKVNNQDRVNRALIKFNLPDLGTCDEIIRAELRIIGFYKTETGNNDYKTLTIHQITTAWDETTATWSNMQNNYNNEAEAVAYIMRSIYDSSNPQESIYQQSLTPCLITDLVKKWYQNTPNNGILIKQSREEYIDNVPPILFSSNCGINSLSPCLIIEYRKGNGLLSYMDYNTQNYTNGKTNINTFNGNLNATFDVASTIGLFPAVLGITYNTNDVVNNYNTQYGLGYSLTLDETIRNINISNVNKLEYRDRTGAIYYFSLNGDKYHDEDGLFLEILYDDNNNNYILNDKNGNKMTFTQYGNTYYLSNIKDLRNYEINIIRNTNGIVTKVIDYNNNEINISYESNSIIFTSPSETTTLNFQNNILQNIVTKDGITSFSYNSNNLITKIIDVTGLSIEYNYYLKKPYKIQSIVHYGLNNAEGESLYFEYRNLSTIITNSNGIIITNIYNYYGNLISSNILPNNGNLNEMYSISKTYGEENDNINKILHKIIPVKFSKNFFKITNQFNMYSVTDVSNYMEYDDEIDSNYTGAGLVKFISTTINQHAVSSFELTSNKTYTLSLDIKSSSNSKISFYYDGNEENPLFEKDINANSDYQKLFFTFNKTNINNLIMHLYHQNICETYIGDINITEGEMLNNCNLIDNSDFSNGTDGWSTTVFSYGDYTLPSVNSVFSVVDIDNFSNKALKVSMDPYYGSKITKNIDVSGTNDQLYYLSFWYKNNGVETSNISGPGSAIGNSVGVYFQPLYGEAEYCIQTYELNSNKGVWQYFSLPFSPSESFKKIIIILNQGRQSGELFITNFSLYKGIKTNKYTYDENQNIVEVSSLSNNNIFSYDNVNELVNISDTRGKNFKLEYDNNYRNRIIRAISTSGISNKIKYDNHGNKVETRISKEYSNEIDTGYYKIRQKGASDYIKLQANTITLMHDYCSNSVFKIEKINNDFRIRDAAIQNRYLSELNGMLVISNNENNTFKLEKNNNSSYHIYTEDNNQNKKYLKWINNHFEFVSNYSDIEDNYLYEYYFEDQTKKFFSNEATYSSDGRFLTSIKDTLLKETVFTTNSINGLITKIKKPNNIEINYTYNNKEMISQISCGNKQVNYSYNNQNLLSNIISGNKNYKLFYDDFLNISNIMINNRNIITNTYGQNNGSLLSSTYGNNNAISYQYDSFERIKKITKEDNVYEYFYNNNGNVYKIKDNIDDINYVYDNENRVIEYRKGLFSIKYKYDNENNIIQKIVKENNLSKTINNTFSIEGQLTETNLDDTNIKYTYDDLLRLTCKKINNSYETKYDYVSIGNRTSSIIKSMTNGQNKYSYEYDNMYNVTKIYLNNILLYHFIYDDYNELIVSEDYKNNIKYEYVYDNGGNILSKTKKNLTTGVTISSDSFEYNDSSWEDLLTKYNNESITYDTIGNPVSIGNKVLTWKNGRQLASYTNNNYSILYKYNLNGVRTEKVVNNVKTEYCLENNKIIFEKTGDIIIYYLYSDEEIIGFVYNNNKYYYIKNLQKDIIGILNSSNDLLVSYEYDAYGNILSIKDSNNQNIVDQTHIGIINPFRYRGYYYDKETNLYYLNSRYYNPEWGRFLNADFAFGENKDIFSYNLFAYVSNSPITYIDVDGYGRTVVIVYNGGKKLTLQAEYSEYFVTGDLDVEMYYVVYVDDFVEVWNDLKGREDIDRIYLYLHGIEGALTFYGKEEILYSSEMNDLEYIQVNDLVALFSCYGGKGTDTEVSVAKKLSTKTNAPVHANTGKVSYGKENGRYYARSAKNPFVSGNWIVEKTSKFTVTLVDNIVKTIYNFISKVTKNILSLLR